MKTKNILIIVILILLAITFLFESTDIEKEKFLVEENGSFNVFFCPQTNCSKIIENEIKEPENIFCAFYDLEEEGIISLLKKKNSVLLVDDSNYLDYGIPIKSSGLMHNKFCILDDKTVIAGSFNPTTDNKNNNNLIIINSRYLSKNYKDEWYDIKNDEETKTKYNEIIFNNYSLKNYFCPEDKCKEKIINEINNAQKSIHFLTFTFTDKDIAEAIILKKEQGVEVVGLIEKFQNHKYSVYQNMVDNNINVTLYSKEGLQHNKLFIIDEKTVLTGSFNPTKAANEKNDENILVIEQTDIVEKYNAYFESLLI